MTAPAARRTLHTMTRDPELTLPGITRIAAQLGLPPDPARDRMVAAWVKANSELTATAGADRGLAPPGDGPLPIARPSETPADERAHTAGIRQCAGRDRGKE